MTFVPVENVARFELVFTHNGIICENVYHVQHAASSWTASDLSETCYQLVIWWDNNIKARVSSNTVLTKIVATSLHTQVSPKIEYVTGLPLTGTKVGNALPGNVTVAVKWVTGNRGRSARGRSYHIGLCEDQVTDNLIDEAFYTALLSAYQALQPTIEDTFRSFRVVSLWSNKVKRTTGVTYRITGVSINSRVDTQRRRLE